MVLHLGGTLQILHAPTRRPSATIQLGDMEQSATPILSRDGRKLYTLNARRPKLDRPEGDRRRWRTAPEDFWAEAADAVHWYRRWDEES